MVVCWLLLNLKFLGDYRIPLQSDDTLDSIDDKNRRRILPLQSYGKSMCCDFPSKMLSAVFTCFTCCRLFFTCITWCQLFLPVLHDVSCFYLYYLLSAVFYLYYMVSAVFTCITCCQLFALTSAGGGIPIFILKYFNRVVKLVYIYIYIIMPVCLFVVMLSLLWMSLLFLH